MITLIARRKLIDAEDLIEVLREKRAETVGYEHKAIGYVIELIKTMPDVSHREEVRNRLP